MPAFRCKNHGGGAGGGLDWGKKLKIQLYTERCWELQPQTAESTLTLTQHSFNARHLISFMMLVF